MVGGRKGGRGVEEGLNWREGRKLGVKIRTFARWLEG